MDDPIPRPLPARSLWQRAREWLAWFGIARLAVLSGSVAAVGAGGFWLLRAPPVPVETSLPRAQAPLSSDRAPTDAPVTTTTVTTVITVPAEIVVHVAGHVADPGVHVLPGGARVVDAVLIAGGATATARTDAINLAQPVHDGDRVYVPGVDDTSGIAAGVTPSGAVGSGDGAAVPAAVPGQPVDLNTATAEQLDTLPGVGPSTASAIVEHRDRHGPFAAVDELDAVTGIGPTRLAALRDLVTV